MVRLRHRFARILTTGLFSTFLCVSLWVLQGTAAADEGKGQGNPSEAKQGEHAHTNRLIHSRNPYLLLHAHNPVDWYPWGPEAITKAKRENKPIFLSVGYSTCYWCQVAEKTIYSNPNIAKMMNQWFVNIKVDREQRPDVDQIYMLATHLLKGRGGWPNNVFLTPDLKPFFAGSYFPPADDPMRGPGFPSILNLLHQKWTEEPEFVLGIAGQVYAAMQRAQKGLAGGEEAPIRPAAWLAQARETLLPQFDSAYGGLLSQGNGSKFAQEPVIDLLLADYRLRRDPRVLDTLSKILDAMAYGGVWDHLGRGFYRYSTERTWSIPHFEKMLYDNAQLLRLYAEAYRETSNALYRQVAINLGDYLSRQMMSPKGGFYTAQDSQVNGEEGASYLWTRKEIESILGRRDSRRFFRVYALTPMPRQFASQGPSDDHRGVLRIRLPITDTLKRAGTSQVVDMLSALEPLRQKLLAVRDQRPQPTRDEKIIVSLNGLAIEALSESGLHLQKPEHITWARQAAERIWHLAFRPATGGLMHEIFRGRAQIDGYLDDYAHLGNGFMSMYGSTKEPIWRHRAVLLADAILQRFARNNGALATTPSEHGLLLRPQDTGDNIYPSGTSATIHLLLRLGLATGNTRYTAAASRVVRHLSGLLEKNPEAWASTIIAVNLYDLDPKAGKRPSGEKVAAATQSQGAASGYHMPDTTDYVRVKAALNTSPDHDEITVTIQVDEGYHINANPASLDYLIPTSVDFESLTPAQINYPKPVQFKPAFAAESLNVYEGSAAVVAIFPKGFLKGTPIVRGQVTAQACNAEICLPPTNLPFVINGPDQ